ncbi:hypothetical protein OCK74_09585 [Chitinophagaceae bacterium LB-8]|uniref:Peptidase MA-like domain-containing protein n=1 Tax=Paraflavisolibacter caeni TaxID=2982496 RepID=A0A9X3B7K5_9BACT|nr:hypothetical protein [Paraflavisolibacter caeni]MCU7549365.1 hypothetical protein [Paraflavisolibacter caeni]
MRKLKIILIALAILLLGLLIVFLLPERRKEMKTQHFTFLFSSSIDSTKISELAKVLESNYSRIGNDFKTKPSDHIEVNIYAQRWRYIKATKNWGGSGNIEGISKLHFVEQAWGESDSRKVAVHEFAHTVTLKLLLDNEPLPFNSQRFDHQFATFPTWLWEAVSVYEAGQFVDPKTLPYLTNGKYPSISELNNRIKGGKIYDCGYTIAEFIKTKFGQDNFIRLIQNYGDLKGTLQLTEEQFCREWYGYIKDKYLK